MRTVYKLLFLLAFLLRTGSMSGQHPGLLLIDIQEFYFPGGRMQLEDPEQAGMNAGLILERFRREGYAVYHVRHNFEPGGSIHPYVKPLEGEKVISKDHVNAFLDTDLLETLRADSIDCLVICGMQTHMCVEAAVRAASDLGFDCLLVQDACTTRALQYEEHIIPAESVHFSTIATLEGTYARVVTTAELLKDLDHFLPH
jgi:nicotinamidase-related amidase